MSNTTFQNAEQTPSGIKGHICLSFNGGDCGCGGGSCCEGLSGMTGYVEYSTEEKVAGKWIDGRTLYRRTFVTNFGPDSPGLVEIANIADLGIDFVVAFECADRNGLAFSNRPIPVYVDETSHSFVAVDSNKILKLRWKGGSKNNADAYVTITYTKS